MTAWLGISMFIVLALPFTIAHFAVKAASRQVEDAYKGASDAVRKYAYIEPDSVPTLTRHKLWTVWILSLVSLTLYGPIVAEGSAGYWICAAWATLGSFGFMAESIG